MRKLARVTDSLGVFFDRSKIPAGVLEAASERGTEVHRACAAYVKGLPVFIGNGAYPYFQSFRNWFDKYVGTVVSVEDEFRDDEVYLFCGHPDLVCILRDGRVAVVDYKTPQVESRNWCAQIAAYCHLVKKRIGRDVEGMALILDSDGGAARAIGYKYQAADFAAFLASLTAWRYFRGGEK